jgi:hypothetical protein
MSRAVLLAILGLSPGLGSAQSLYAGAGIGPTFVLDAPAGGKSTYTNVYGVLGWQPATPLGVRLEGAETFGWLYLSLDAEYRFGGRGATVRPYAFAGPGAAIDLSEINPLVDIGGGVWWTASPPLSLFAECRLHQLLTGDQSPGQTLLPITIGVAVGGH